MSSPSRKAFATRLALESAVIIASILAAFALDTWWDGVQQREDERVALTSLRTEFQDAKAQILQYRSYQERIFASVSAVADSLHLAVSEGRARVSLPDTMLSLAYIPPTTSVGLGTLRGLIASGRLGIIQDPELRTALGAWGIELDELTEEEVDSRSLAYGDMDRVLRERISTYGLWETGEMQLDDRLDEETARRRRDLPVDTEVLGVFTLRAALLQHAIREFEELIAAVDEMLRLIEGSVS